MKTSLRVVKYQHCIRSSTRYYDWITQISLFRSSATSAFCYKYLKILTVLAIYFSSCLYRLKIYTCTSLANINIPSSHPHNITTQLLRYLSLCRQLLVHLVTNIYIFGCLINISEVAVYIYFKDMYQCCSFQHSRSSTWYYDTSTQISFFMSSATSAVFNKYLYL